MPQGESLEAQLARIRAARGQRATAPAEDPLEARLERIRQARPTPVLRRDVTPRAAAVRPDATRVTPRPASEDTPNILKRTGTAAKEFAREVKKNPVKTVATMVASPLKSASDAFIAPAVGESRLTSGDAVVGKDKDGFLIVRNARTGRTRRLAPDQPTYDAEHGAVTGKQRAAGLAQVAAEVLAGPVAGKITKIAKPRVGTHAARAAGGAVAGAGVGATNAPDDPGVGAIFGTALGAAAGAGAPALRDKVVEVAPRAAERVRAGARAGVAGVRAGAERVRSAAERIRALRASKQDAVGIPEPVGIPAPDAPPPRTTVARIPTSAIDVDAARFQFKQVKDPATGTSGELKSVERFNPDLAGVIAVWRDPANGRTYVVNGHHRVELAKRTAHPEMDVRYITARTAEEARARGALINIAEGRGTPVDVGKFIRDTGASPDLLREEGVSLRGALARDGVALSRLAPDLFDRVARGEVEQRHAVAIGAMLDDAALQRAAVQLIEGRRLTDSEVTEVTRQVRDAGSESVKQETLFGTEATSTALIIERAQLAAAMKKRLSADRRIFGFVAKEGRAGELERAGNVIDVEQSRAIAGESAQLEEIFDRLYTRSGPVADALNDGARRIAHGEKPRVVADELYDHVRSAVSEALGGGDPRGGPRSGGHAAERAIEPGPGDATGVDELGLRDSLDPNQSAFLAPRRVSPPRGDVSPVDLFGERQATAPEQTGLFGGREGTAAARSLAQTEAAARGELARLRDAFRLEQDPGRRAAHVQRIAELERLVNRDKAITAGEMATRAAADAAGAPQAREGTLTPAEAAAPEATMFDGEGFQETRTRGDMAKAEGHHRAAFSASTLAKQQGLVYAFDADGEVTAIVPPGARLTDQQIREGLTKAGLKADGATVIREKPGHVRADDDVYTLGTGRREPPTGLTQEALFSPAVRSSPLGKIAQKVGQKVRGQPPTGDVKSLREISVTLAKMVGVPLRRGRFGAKRMGARGAFWPKPEVTRVQRLKWVDTAAHEVGHFLSKKYLRNPTMKVGGRGRSLPKGAGKELVQMGKNLYGSRKPAGGYGEEGIAEWTSFYVTEPHRLPVEAPIFTSFMESVLKNEPALLSALDQAAGDFARYEASPASEKIGAMISVGEHARFRPTAKWFTRNVLDDLEEFREATETLGSSRDVSRNAYALARLTRGDGGLAQDIVQRGAVDFASKQRVSRGLEEILTDVGPENVQAFREYLVAERTLEKAAQGIDTGVDLKASQDVATQGRKQFQQHAAQVWEYSNGNLAYLRDAGLLTPGEFQAITKKNAKRVPFYRVIDPSETGAGQGTGRSFVRNASGIHKLRGSDRTIIDPLESLVGETYRLISRANKHHAAQTLVRQALATEGGGALVELLPEIPQEMRRIDVAKVREQLEDLGFTPPDDPAELAALGDAVLSAFYEKPRPGAAETRDLVMTVLVEGERRWVAIKDRELWNGIQHMDVAEVATWAKPLEAVNRTLRLGATLSPDFSATNPIRDMFHTAIFSRGPTRPPGYHFLQGVFSAFNQDALFQRFMQEGGMNAGLIGFDRRSHQRQLRQVTEGKLGKNVAKAMIVAKHPIDALRMVSELMENANRQGEFKAVRQDRMKKGASEVSASKEGALAARDLIDFAQAGVQVRGFNRIIAFLNAHIRDTAKLVQEHAGLFSRIPARRKRAALVMARATAWLTVPSIALYLAQRNNPAYHDVPEWAKNTGWIVMLPGGRYVWIPRPFFLGTLYGRLPELALEAIDDVNPEALDDAFEQLAKGVTPPIIPTAARPIFENFANESLFRDRPIVPRSVEGLDPDQQARERTGETARLAARYTTKLPLVGEQLGPAKLENLVTGYTGGLGRYGLQAVDAAVTGARDALGKERLSPPPQEGEGGVTELPVARRFVHAPPGEDAEVVERIHRQFQAAERRRLTWRMKVKRGDMESASRYLEQHRAEIISVATREDTGGEPGPLRASYEALTELRGMKRDVVRGRGSDAKHRAALIEQQMVRIGRQHRERENARP